MKERSFYKSTPLGEINEKEVKDYRGKYKSIQIPITEEDIRMFQELVHHGREPFMWTFDGVNVEFTKEEEEEE